MMKFLELFSGTRRMADTFEKYGYDTYTIEIDTSFPRIDSYKDILNVTAEEILREFGRPTIIWASPPCTTYSVSAIYRHREQDQWGNLNPKSSEARLSDELVKHTLALIKELNPKAYYIENPRAALRKMDFMQDLPRYTVTYCQYGDERMKATDIWSSHPDPKFKSPCNFGMSCHVSAPRGSQTGTQGLKNAKERAMIPIQLCEHIAQISKELEDNAMEPMDKRPALSHELSYDGINMSIYDIIGESEYEEGSRTDTTGY